MVKKVLSINHSDTSALSGIQSDLQSFQENNVFGFTVITSLTTSDDTNKYPLEIIDSSVIKKQLDSVFSDGTMDAIKIGRINSMIDAEIIANFINEYGIKNIVLEVTFKDINKNYIQFLLPLIKILVIKNLEQTVSNHEAKKIAQENYQKHLIWVCVPDIEQDKSFLIYDGSNFSHFSYSHDDFSAFLTAELAQKQELKHLLN